MRFGASHIAGRPLQMKKAALAAFFILLHRI
jgi:hypothetical protein